MEKNIRRPKWVWLIEYYSESLCTCIIHAHRQVNEHISATEKQSIKTTDVNIDVIDSRQRWLADHYGNGSCHSNSERKYFRAKIMPDSNEQAEDELKKELK